MHGFHKGSMEGVARAAGISKVTLYNYFASKAALFNAIVTEPVSHAIALDAKALPADDPQGSLLRIALVFLERVTAPETIEHVRLLHDGLAQQSPLAAAFFEGGPEAVVRTLKHYLQRANREGALSVPNTARAAEQFLAMVRGNEQIRLLLGQPPLRMGKAREQYCRECVEMFIGRYARRSDR